MAIHMPVTPRGPASHATSGRPTNQYTTRFAAKPTLWRPAPVSAPMKTQLQPSPSTAAAIQPIAASVAARTSGSSENSATHGCCTATSTPAESSAPTLPSRRQMCSERRAVWPRPAPEGLQGGGGRAVELRPAPEGLQGGGGRAV
eukprot:360265-Chlamydomonas_euryale.AAC.1